MRPHTQPPKGKFRVMCVDMFSYEDWSAGDYKTFSKAKEVAISKAAPMTRAHVIDDKNNSRFVA